MKVLSRVANLKTAAIIVMEGKKRRGNQKKKKTEIRAEHFVKMCIRMGPLHVSDHMLQKPPYWNANCALGHLNKAN